MTKETLKKFLNFQVNQLSARASNGVLVEFPKAGLDEFLDAAIEAGLNDFWSARAWPFRRVSYTIPITVATNPYTLPSDFAAFFSVIETTSTRGSQLIYLTKSEFDLRYPKPELYGSGQPCHFTVGKIQGENAWKMWFAPIPATGTTIPSIYLSAPPKGVELVDDNYTSGLMAGCTKFLFPRNSDDFMKANAAAQAEYNRLETIPAFYAGLPTQAGDVTIQVQPWSPFVV